MVQSGPFKQFPHLYASTVVINGRLVTRWIRISEFFARWPPILWGRTTHHRTHTYYRFFFQYFSHSFTKLNDFCVIGCANWRVTNILWVSAIKELRKHRKRMSDSLFQFFLKNSSWYLSTSIYPHIFLFFSPFWVIKNLMGVPTKAFEKINSFKRRRCNNHKI